MVIIFIIAAIVAVIVALKYRHAECRPHTSVVAFTGTMGSGKTFSAVSMLRAEYRIRRIKYRLIDCPLWRLKGRRTPEPVPPSVWSTIPLRVRGRGSRAVYAHPLTVEHLTCADHLPENSLLLIDEISVVCDQYDFDDPLVVERFGRLIKFFRHWTGGKIYITEQAVSCVTKPIRDKLGTIYQCEGLHRWCGFLPWVIVSVRPIVMVDAEVSSTSTEVVTDSLPYFVFFSLPRLLRRKGSESYDSRCYRPIYHRGASRVPDFGSEGPRRPRLDTRYLPDLTATDSQKTAYKRCRSTEKGWIYLDDPDNPPTDSE